MIIIIINYNYNVYPLAIYKSTRIQIIKSQTWNRSFIIISKIQNLTCVSEKAKCVGKLEFLKI